MLHLKNLQGKRAGVKIQTETKTKEQKKCLSLTLKYVYAEALTTSRGPLDCHAHYPKKGGE